MFTGWAPAANAVHIAIADSTPGAPAWAPSESTLLVKDASGFWSGFVPGVLDGTKYRFYVEGRGSQGFKRDPYARELEQDGYPDCDCIVRTPDGFVWHDAGFVPPRFKDLIIYQFHFGVYYAKGTQGRDIRPFRVCKFLDVIDRIEYLADRVLEIGSGTGARASSSSVRGNGRRWSRRRVLDAVIRK